MPRRVSETKAQYVARPRDGLKHLTPNERAALADYLARLRAKFPRQIERAILYGSKARGDSTEESDVDLLIVIKSNDAGLREAVSEQAHASQSAYDVVLSSVVASQADLQKHARGEPFYRSVLSEGIDVWGQIPRRTARGTPLVYRQSRRRFKVDENAKIVIQVRLEKCHRDIGAAHNALRAGFYDNAVAVAYYAVFAITTAVLLTQDLVRAKHSGVESAFSQFFIKEKRIEPEYKDIFVRARQKREIADYGDKFATEEEARLAIAEAEKFVARMEQYLREAGVIE